MTRANNCSILNNLVSHKILKIDNKTVIFTEEIQRDFSNLSYLLNNPPFGKILIFIPEYRIELIKMIFFEICYTVVRKKSERVNIITDNPGRSFILEFFAEYYADRGDLKTILLKYFKKEISFFVDKRIPASDVNSINLFYRTFDMLLNNKIPDRSVCLITLEDIYKFGDDFQKYMCELKKENYSLFLFSDNGFHPDDGRILPPIVCQCPQKWDDIKKLTSGFSKNASKFLSESYLFYNTVCLPLKMCYDEWDMSLDEKPLFPSKRVNVESSILDIEKNQLIEILKLVEDILENNNPKYHEFNLIFSKCNLTEGKHCVILPSSNSVNSFVYNKQGNKDTVISDKSEWTVLTQEELFFKLSYVNQKYQNIIFPFLPNPLALLMAKKFSERLILILYRKEMELYDTLISETCQIPDKIKKVYNCEKNPPINDTFLKYQYLLRNQKRKFANTLPSVQDNNLYIFHAADGQVINIRGDQDVILYLRQFSQQYEKYRWIQPQAVKEGDVIIIIPDEIRKTLLIELMKNELLKSADDIELYIEFLACWRKGLRHVERMGLSLQEIYSRLMEGGLDRDIMTIRGWFKGLSDDPVKCALDSLISKDMIIGPQKEIDILKFGEIFNLERIKINYHEIFSSMNYFREKLRKKGFLVPNIIVQRLADYNFKIKCNMIRISGIEVKYEE
jgi:hypothetical protein